MNYSELNNSKTEDLSFSKEVLKYFMNFLETDFKKRRLPKRNNNNQTLNGLKTTFDLEKYPNLKKSFFAHINTGFEKEKIEIKKGQYVANIPDKLLDLIQAKIKNLKQEIATKLIEALCVKLQSLLTEFNDQYDKYLEEANNEFRKSLAQNITSIFLDAIDKPLENLGLSDVNGKFQIESDLSEVLFSDFEERANKIFQKYFLSQDAIALRKSLDDIFKIPEIQSKILSFFDELAVSDAYEDLYKLHRNNQLIDKTDIYFYFYELSHDQDSFPVFYIPLSVEKHEGKFILNFDQRVFVNTKGIDYALQNLNIQTGEKSSTTADLERVLYLSDIDFEVEFQNILKRIETLFFLKNEIDNKDSKFQKKEHLISSLSNRCYLYLFDKSDESLINDYEEILNDQGELAEKFRILVDKFIEENPEPYMQPVKDEWTEQSIPEKLVFESPVPLNEEQKQVLIALNKPNCKYMILEGPPGTGKSHTITAIICRALLEEKSVLVLSDKKEALDVVEDKITNTLNQVRVGEQFQNPILRLGKTGNKFYKIVQGQTIQTIKDHYNSYKAHQEESVAYKQNQTLKIQKNIKENINHFQKIDISKVESYVTSLEKFSKTDWIDNKSIAKVKNDFQKIKEAILVVHSCSDLPFKANYILEKHYLPSLELLHNLKLAKEIKNKLSNFSLIEELVDSLRALDLRSLELCKTTFLEIKDIFENLSANFHDISVSSLVAAKNAQSLNALKIHSSTYHSSFELAVYTQNHNIPSQDDCLVLKNLLPPHEEETTLLIESLKSYITELENLKNPILGFAFKGRSIFERTRVLKKSFYSFNIDRPQKHLRSLKKTLDLFEFIEKKSSEYISDTFHNTIEILALLYDIQLDRLACADEILSQLIFKIEALQSIFRQLNIKQIEDVLLLIDLIELEKNIHEKYKNLKDVDIATINVFSKNLDDHIQSLQELSESISQALKVESAIKFLNTFQNSFPKISNKISLSIESQDLNSISCELLHYSDEYISDYITFKEVELELTSDFTNIPDDKFSESIQELESLSTAEMTHFLDKRIIEYVDEFAGEVNVLKSIIRNKNKFPKKLFKNLKKAFPCILAGIRDYADFIPLQNDLFDLIIIDEASQVSIAQALPALLRGKQIIVLGDEKQFSNVKSNNASSITNQHFKSKIKTAFCTEKELDETNDPSGWLTKVTQNFDIKNSILKFMRFIRNYECQLRKHFRGYPEIISYSNQYFYNNYLQCMKIRGKPIEEVIKFSVIEHDGKVDISKNTNELEAEFIVKELKAFKDNNNSCTVGIITPHREQVILLYDMINSLPERDWLFKNCDLKIMTFDTCQGEERDYIFYSMVATVTKDRLSYIFIKDLSSKEDDDSSVKAQRLNVGFSRAKECVHFILSKPIESYTGEIKNALLHYREQLEKARKHPIGKTDPSSPMEAKIEHYFYQTDFYKNDSKNIELIPQFPLGDYLKQIDRTYQHPSYKVDFLLIYKNEKIVIEYDGFKEHFTNLVEVSESNFQSYMKPDDVYRQKILEGYGYKFLRINRFNIGENPVETLDLRLSNLLKKKPITSSFLDRFKEKIFRLQEGHDRACDLCENVLNSSIFPFKTVDLCLYCYEKTHSKTLHTFRETIKTSHQKYTDNKPIASCNNQKLNLEQQIIEVLKKHGALKAKEISKHLSKEHGVQLDKKSVNQSLYYKLKDKAEQNDEFEWSLKKQNHTPKEQLSENKENLNNQLVSKALTDHLLMKLTYNRVFREIKPYACDGKYCIAHCEINKELRTFRVDKMSNISLSKQFEVVDNQLREANKKIENIKKGIWR